MTLGHLIVFKLLRDVQGPALSYDKVSGSGVGAETEITRIPQYVTIKGRKNFNEQLILIMPENN